MGSRYIRHFRGRAMRRLLASSLVFFGLVATIFEPLFYASHPQWWSGEPVAQWMTHLWQRLYITPFDPIFDNPPLWLRVMCWIEVLVFGPLYLVSAYLLRVNHRLQSVVVMPFAGALLYSTLLYFFLEFWDPVPGTHTAGVLLINCPWIVLPVALFVQQAQHLTAA